MIGKKNGREGSRERTKVGRESEEKEAVQNRRWERKTEGKEVGKERKQEETMRTTHQLQDAALDQHPPS